MVTLRRYRPDRPQDRLDVYDVCVRTADAGEDARGVLAQDDLWGDVFAGPYLALEPELAFVLDDGERVVGYVLGTADTAQWAQAQRARWLPTVTDRYPLPDEPATREEQLVDLLHHPERNVRPELVGYPAHLHIDILPEHQGAGHGRALIEAFVTALAERGVPGVHLGVSTVNTRARAFYEHVGFHELPVEAAGVVLLGRTTGVAA